MDPDRTPRNPSGSHEIAVMREVCCQRLATLLEQAAEGGTLRRLIGRPDLRMLRLARVARALGDRFRRWYDPPEGDEVRADMTDRANDLAAYGVLLVDARALGVRIS